MLSPFPEQIWTRTLLLDTKTVPRHTDPIAELDGFLLEWRARRQEGIRVELNVALSHSGRFYTSPKRRGFSGSSIFSLTHWRNPGLRVKPRATGVESALPPAPEALRHPPPPPWPNRP